MSKNTGVEVVRQENGAALMRRPDADRVFVQPRADIYETRDAFVLIVDLPGTSRDALSVLVEKSSLIIRGRVERYHEQGATMLYNELHDADYARVFNLGEGIDRDNIDAWFDQGVLTVKLFKHASLQPREITIR